MSDEVGSVGLSDGDLDRWLEVREAFAGTHDQRVDDAGRLARDVLALVAEVRRLRGEVRDLDDVGQVDGDV